MKDSLKRLCLQMGNVYSSGQLRVANWVNWPKRWFGLAILLMIVTLFEQ